MESPVMEFGCHEIIHNPTILYPITKLLNFCSHHNHVGLLYLRRWTIVLWYILLLSLFMLLLFMLLLLAGIDKLIHFFGGDGRRHWDGMLYMFHHCCVVVCHHCVVVLVAFLFHASARVWLLCFCCRLHTWFNVPGTSVPKCMVLQYACTS